VLFIHETHQVKGAHEDEFEAAFRDDGTYMADALTYRDQWESRLLRTSAWSPLY
jgi:hypothetical protein